MGGTLAEPATERTSFLLDRAAGLTRRQAGAAWAVSGLPAASSTWRSWASKRRAGPVVRVGQKRNRPADSRFWQSQNPWPS